jgi:hypothetical protein
VVTEIGLNTLHVSDLSPMAACRNLKILICGGDGLGKKKLTDLSPLRGLPVETLYCPNTQVADLSPLAGMPLTYLNLGGSMSISDVSPLESCKSLATLHIRSTKVTPADVAALQKALPDCKIEWDAVPPTSPAGEGAKRKTP